MGREHEGVLPPFVLPVAVPYIFRIMKTVTAFYPFNALTAHAADDFTRAGERQVWQTGDLVFKGGDLCSGMHVVTDGLFQVYRESLEGRQQIVHLLRPGGILAVAPLIDEAPYPVSARALTRSETLFVPRADFDRLFRDHNDFARAVLLDLAMRHRTALELLDTIALKPVHARVATLLVKTAQRFNAAHDDGQFEFVLTQEQLASAIATTREGVARSLARLRKEGVIEQRASSIHILDWNRLLHSADAVTDPATLHVTPLGVTSEELE